jgi:MoaA/NifB/PqqE/SkfB family radical SAM enzyme
MINLIDYFTNGDKWLYTLLANEKQETFPSDYTLSFLYTYDQYNNNESAGDCILKLQEYLALVDIPNFFVTIYTNNSNILHELNHARILFAPHDINITTQIIDGNFIKEISKKDSLCIYPWIHLYINSQGLVGTCCEFNENYPLDHISKSELIDIANNDNMKLVRQQMLSNQRPEGCITCWKKEDNNLPSARQIANERWSKYKHLIDTTASDGSFPDFKLRYLDARFSNVCNLKCRMCGGKFSSRIAQEESDLYDNNDFVELKLERNEINKTLQFIEDNIYELDAVYFAGGEPLLMAEHYQILDLLIKHNRTDIQITYNTNLTVLSYKKLNVIDYWKQFNNITVGASIDLIGTQANYVRFGTDYTDIEKNYHLIKNHVTFNITSIVHILNIFNLTKLQYHWITNLKLNPSAISFRALIYPENMSLQVLPSVFKRQATSVIEQHIIWLLDISNTEHLVITWREVLNYMNSADSSHLLKDFFRLNDDKDRYRNEKFEEIFPEYINLRSYV